MNNKTIRLAACIVAISVSSGAAQSEIKKFSSPRHGGYLLDWCLDWNEVGCGKKTATAFCKTKGFKTSVGYKKWENPGKPTKQIATNSVCDADFCDSFRSIMCER
jgi:hypothetical protein